MIKIFNTLTRKKEIFKPYFSNKVNIYVCGITAYDLCHIGNGRTFVAFDVVIRYLKYRGFKVNYIRNITDIEDKIIKRASKNLESYKDLTSRIIKEMHIDCDQLNLLHPNDEPKVTNYINIIIKFISKLIQKKHAYIAINGDVMFSVNSANNYGLLSRQNLCKLKTNIKTNNIKNKNDPVDFVLWKISKPGEPNWISPWGNGRPGWHIECSAIKYNKNNYNFDIHGGGSDLIFPHHENDIAQSTCINTIYNNNIWMHTGMVSINNKKMSKSLNNILTLRSAFQHFDPETIRYFFTSSHYRSQINYNEDNLRQSRLSLKRLYNAIDGTKKNKFSNKGKDFINKFINAMDDDFNTPKAYSILFKIANEINKLKKICSPEVDGMASTLRYLANILGVLTNDHIHFFQTSSLKNINKNITINTLINKRNQARISRQWIIADNIRNKLEKYGIILNDSKKDTTWRKK